MPPALVGRPKPDESAPYRSKRLLEPPGVRDGDCPRAGVPNARPDGVVRRRALAAPPKPATLLEEAAHRLRRQRREAEAVGAELLRR